MQPDSNPPSPPPARPSLGRVPAAGDRCRSEARTARGKSPRGWSRAARPLPPPSPRRAAAPRNESRLAGGGECGGDVTLEVAERLDAFQVIVGDADAELFLDLEHELDERQRVDAEGVERRGWGERVGIERELLAGEILDARERVHRGEIIDGGRVDSW